MDVVRISPDRSFTVLGTCSVAVNLPIGAAWQVHEPFAVGFPTLQGTSLGKTAVRTGVFHVVPVHDCPSSVVARGVIEVRADSPPVEWLPGWRPISPRGITISPRGITISPRGVGSHFQPAALARR